MTMAKKMKDESHSESMHSVSEKAAKLEALIHVSKELRESQRRTPMTFHDFLHLASINPVFMFRDINQLFHDMLHHYVPHGTDEFPVSDDSIGFLHYDSSGLFIDGCDDPFFADRLFMNRLMSMADGFRKGTFTNNIFLFEGPPGSGKSTFLNNLMYKMEDYTKQEAGASYKVYWRLNIEKLGGFRRFRGQLETGKRESEILDSHLANADVHYYSKELMVFSCPNHDHPILMIPKSLRRQFLDELISDSDFKATLFTEKQYEWIFKSNPCTICRSIFDNLLDILEDPLEVFNMIYVRSNIFSRQLGECVSIFNPGDRVMDKPIINTTQQQLICDLFDNDDVRFTYSYLAKTNNGVLALMDIKGHNIQRMKNYHGIISDGVHKVDLHEERINTLFLGLVNPEDKKNYDTVESFQDRIIALTIPYILDYNTELSIYYNKLGKIIANRFMPMVLNNFAKIIISTRLDNSTPAIKKWIKNPEVYNRYLDKDMFLLKMDIYTGNVPDWLSEEDVKSFDKAVRSDIIKESQAEGSKGVSGRQSLLLLNRFISKYEGSDYYITMDMLNKFFSDEENVLDAVTYRKEFIESITDLYDYEALQEVKHSLYQYNEEHLSNEIKNYLFAINYELGVKKHLHWKDDQYY